jgi:RHS repeat-associated protein
LDFGAGFYDPATAIFLQQDPLAEKYYNLSPYAYCANNPVNFVDPDGRISAPKDYPELLKTIEEAFK